MLISSSCPRRSPRSAALRACSIPPRSSIAGHRRRWRRQHQRLAELDDLRDAPIVDHLETYHSSDVQVSPPFARAVDQMVNSLERNLENIVFVIVGNTKSGSHSASI